MSKDSQWPMGSQLQTPDGALYVYLQAAQKLPKGTFIEVNPNRRLTRFQGGERLPEGVTVEDVDKEEWSFVKVRDGQAPKPQKTVLSPEELGKINASKT